MENRIQLEEMRTIFNKSRHEGFIKQCDDSIIFFNLDLIKRTISDVKKSFPYRTLHAIAIKTNPLIEILKVVHKNEVGLEAASFTELKIAEYSGFNSNELVFDSPVKTRLEIEQAIELGVHLNIDNFEELEIVSTIAKNAKATFGLRINPQIGSGSIQSMSVAGDYSKFGIPLKEFKQEIIDTFVKHTWLTGLHVHSGSQGLSLSKLSDGVQAIYNLAEEINSILERNSCKNRIKIIDIGGGLPIAYSHKESTPSVEDYARLISDKCPLLFSDKYKIITEFGRYIYGHSGWTISKIEYIKTQQNYNTALIHVGADLFMRECYNPNDWFHQFDTLKSDGTLNLSDKKKYIIGGPLCFGGDIIQRDVELSELAKGDYIIIHDTGANNINLWSRHCSREMPKVIGYSIEQNKLRILKQKESIDDIINFWK